MKKTDKESTAFDSIYRTLEWLISAFAVTLVFIVFQMQAYTIPTGSMADTLKGAHFRLCCSKCGYHYDYDFVARRYGITRNTTPGQNVPVKPSYPRCPSCGYYLQLVENQPVVKGDRIFVLKNLYQFVEPKRWDVVVFKNPTNPVENYIKRLIGKPGETVELFDGDVYINDQIARKPKNVQEELWMCVYDNDYQPVNPTESRFNGHIWSQPFVNVGDSKWNIGQTIPSSFMLDGEGEETHVLIYDTNTGNDFKATHAYDHTQPYPFMPICSDLMVRFFVKKAGDGGIVGAVLSKYGIRYRGWVDYYLRRAFIERIDENGEAEVLVDASMSISSKGLQKFRFANVDHELVLEFGEDELRYDLGAGKEDAGTRRNVMPQVSIFGRGKLELTHVGLMRDIHYISSTINRVIPVRQAGEGKPFTLDEDEFFVLGDNTPASSDARCWDRPGTGNSGHEYRQGTVPRDYLVGKAFFVYWPGPYKPFNATGLAEMMERNKVLRFLKILLNVPCPGGMKVIYGGETFSR